MHLPAPTIIMLNLEAISQLYEILGSALSKFTISTLKLAVGCWYQASATDAPREETLGGNGGSQSTQQCNT
jgi:hypothetical protein